MHAKSGWVRTLKPRYFEDRTEREFVLDRAEEHFARGNVRLNPSSSLFSLVQISRSEWTSSCGMVYPLNNVWQGGKSSAGRVRRLKPTTLPICVDGACAGRIGKPPYCRRVLD